MAAVWTVMLVLGASSDAGQLTAPRSFHTATLLLDGRVLVAGGDTSAPRSCELWDPALDAWSPCAQLNAGRLSHAAIRLDDGRVLLVGGSATGSSPMQTTTEVFDPGSGLWTMNPGQLPVGKGVAVPALATLPNGKVLIAGGWDGAGSYATCWELDPATGLLNPTGPLAVPRRIGAVAVTAKGVLYTGGISAMSGGVASSELYDPVARTWSDAGTMSVARYYHTATTLLDGRVLVVGSDRADLYDPATGGWTDLGPAPATVNHAATLLPDGRVLITGGSPASANTWVFEPATQQWLDAGMMATARAGHTATLLLDGGVLVAGGADVSGAPMRAAEVFTPQVAADAGAADAGTGDAGTADAGTPDAGAADGGRPDAGRADAGAPDAGTPRPGELRVGCGCAESPSVALLLAAALAAQRRRLRASRGTRRDR